MQNLYAFGPLLSGDRWAASGDLKLSSRQHDMECLISMKADRVIPSIKVRAAKLEDTESIASVLNESFAEFESLYTPEAFAATTPTSDEICARWSEGPIWVVFSHSDVVGTISAVVEKDSLYVRSMAVLPSARAQNIGHLLLKEVEAYAIAHNCKRMFLSTTPFLTRAIKLYERCGFQRSCDGPNELFGTPLFTMEKRLISSGLNQGFPNKSLEPDG